jgi:hypothetical protein
MPGMMRKAGKVIRLKMPNTTTSARIDEVNAEDRFCYIMLDIHWSVPEKTYLGFHNPLN